MKTLAIILAAGKSSRMQLNGKFKSKALLPLPYKNTMLPALTCLVKTYWQAGVHDIVLVSGYHKHETETLGKKLGLICINNTAPWAGMLSSVHTALNAISIYDNIFINPVDVPLIAVDTIKTLLIQAAIYPDIVLIPSYTGKQGHPPLIPGQYKESILAHDGHNGLAGALQNLPNSQVEVCDAFVLEDMDTPNDYDRLCHMVKSYD